MNFLFLVTAWRTTTTSTLELPSLGTDMGFGVGARQTRGWAEVLVGFSGCTDSLDKNSVLSSGGTDCQLIEGQNGASSFNDTGASSFSDTQSTDLQSSKFNVKIAIQVHVQEHMLGFWVQTDCSYCQQVINSYRHFGDGEDPGIISNSSNNDGDSFFAACHFHESRQASNWQWGTMNFRHEQTFQDDTVELALGTSGQESVQLVIQTIWSASIFEGNNLWTLP